MVPAVVQQMAAQQGRVPPPPQPPLQDIPAAAAATDATPAAPAGGAAVGAAVPPPPQGGKPFSAFPHTPAALPSALGSGPGAAPALLAAPSLAAQAQQQNLSVLAGGGLPMYPSCGTDGSSRQVGGVRLVWCCVRVEWFDTLTTWFAGTCCKHAGCLNGLSCIRSHRMQKPSV